MRYIIFINSEDRDLETIASGLSSVWDIRVGDGYIEMSWKDENDRYVVLEYSDSIEQDYDNDEKSVIESTFESPRFCYLKYSDLDTLKRALHELVRGGKCIVDNDHGDFLPGDAFMKKWENHAGWDWVTVTE